MNLFDWWHSVVGENMTIRNSVIPEPLIRIIISEYLEEPLNPIISYLAITHYKSK